MIQLREMRVMGTFPRGPIIKPRAHRQAHTITPMLNIRMLHLNRKKRIPLTHRQIHILQRARIRIHMPRMRKPLPTLLLTWQ